MSVCRKLPDGTIQKIAGHTILLDANASEVRQGRWNLVSTGVGWVEQNIIFTDPMPDNDYIVIIESDAQTWSMQPGPYRITNKTTTGFTLASFNDNNAAGQVNMNMAGTYTAFKPVKIEGYTALQNKINNPDNTPTIDSMNLVTSDGVARAIENASAVWKGTKAEWNALPATTKIKYDLAVLIDTQLIKSVDRTDGSDTDVADLGQIWKGTRTEWESLSLAERKTHGVAFFTDKRYAVSVDPTTGDESNLVDWTGVWKGSMDDWEAMTQAERDEWDVCITPTIAASDTNPFRTLSDPETLSIAPNTDYTCPHDGFIVTSPVSVAVVRYFINNVQVAQSGRDNTAGSTETLPVQKGDVFKYVLASGSGAVNVIARWYTNETSPGPTDTPVLYRSQSLDWDNKVVIPDTDLVAGWTAPADGYFIGSIRTVSSYGSAISHIYVNGSIVAIGMNTTDHGNCQIPVQKGDIVSRSANGSASDSPAIFVPYKDYPDYSTTEHWTGKRWIDGKKIYSRVFTGLSVAINPYNNWSNVCSVPNADTLVSYRAKSGNNSDWSSDVLCAINSGTCQMYNCANLGFTCTMVILEYTKTTD